MKVFFTAITIAWSLTHCLAQDSAYYYTAFNSADDSLKAKLHNIIKGHTEFPYTSASTDVWDILQHTDRDTLNSSNVILLYSNRSIDGPQEYNSGNGWTREHVWAKSRGDFGTSNGAGTDVHHLRPVDNGVNSTRNNRNFDECVTCINVIDNGFNTGSKRDANLWTFEPPDNVKGDVARMIFYMAVRYEGDAGEPDLELTDVLQDDTAKAPLHAVKTTLLAWNRIDPVSNWEKNRNLIIYNDYQHNRNPFIDYPELAEHIWGDSTGVVWKAVSTVGIEELAGNNFIVYPNPSAGLVRVSSKTVADEYIVYDALGNILVRTKPDSLNTTIDLHHLKSGLYFIVQVSQSEVARQKVLLEF